jgi:DNA-binding GntR family transcriptional regulator
MTKAISDDEELLTTTHKLPPPSRSETFRLGSGMQAAAYIRRLIFDGQLAPGSRVPQAAIAEALGISRPPVREALSILEKEGRVTLEINRGAFVNAMNEQAIRDIADVASMVNSFIARKAAERASDITLERLRRLQQEINKCNDPDGMLKLCEQYLDLLMEASAAPRMARVFHGMRTLVNNYFEVPTAVNAFKKGSARATAAILTRDAESAGKAWADSEQGAYQIVIGVYREKGLLSGS